MSKSKGGGRDKTASLAPVVPQPPPVKEIVRGRVTEVDWKELVSDDEDADVIASVLADLVGGAWEILYKRMLERALWPYTADWAKETVETIVEWQFLERDESDKDTHLDPSWMEDEEPAPAQIDAWARGAVPKNVVKVRPETPPLKHAKKSVGDKEVTDKKAAAKIESTVDDHTPSATDEIVNILVPTQGPSYNTSLDLPTARKKKVPRRTKQQQRLAVAADERTERVDERSETSTQITALERRANDPLHASSSLLRVQRGRPPGRKDVVYDSKGNVTQAVRLHPGNFPSHRANTRFAVVNSSPFDDPSRVGSYRPAPPQMSHKLPERRTTRYKESHRHVHGSQATPLSASLIDSINLSAGVLIREAGRTKAGADNPTQPALHAVRPLQPVVPIEESKTIATASVVSSGSPVIRPINSVPLGMPDRRSMPPIATTKQPQNVST